MVRTNTAGEVIDNVAGLPPIGARPRDYDVQDSGIANRLPISGLSQQTGSVCVLRTLSIKSSRASSPCDIKDSVEFNLCRDTGARRGQFWVL